MLNYENASQKYIFPSQKVKKAKNKSKSKEGEEGVADSRGRGDTKIPILRNAGA
jgi:hypothetical protein